MQDKQQVDQRKLLEKLPYVFKDPVNFDKKVDPRDYDFGSKVTGNDLERGGGQQGKILKG